MWMSLPTDSQYLDSIKFDHKLDEPTDMEIERQTDKMDGWVGWIDGLEALYLIVILSISSSQ